MYPHARYFALAVLAAVSLPTQGSAQLRSDIAEFRISDAVVVGTATFHFSGSVATGTLKAAFVLKGPRLKYFKIVNQLGDGPAEDEAPRWRPLYEVSTGKFYLRRLARGTYEILSVDGEVNP